MKDNSCCKTFRNILYKRRYLFKYERRRVSPITFIRYAYSKKI